MSNMQQIKDRLTEHSEVVIDMVATHIANLGSKYEWDMEDNFSCTEDMARLASRVGLPPAGDQTAQAQAFYEQAVMETN